MTRSRRLKGTLRGSYSTASASLTSTGDLTLTCIRCSMITWASQSLGREAALQLIAKHSKRWKHIRLRRSYNIAGTNTGRFSSSFSEFGTGGNLQNVEESLRSIFISDEGYKFAKFDAKSGESFIVGAIEWNLFDDPRYLEACESGDPHTAVARICWPNLGWTGSLEQDKSIAEQSY